MKRKPDSKQAYERKRMLYDIAKVTTEALIKTRLNDGESAR